MLSKLSIALAAVAVLVGLVATAPAQAAQAGARASAPRLLVYGHDDMGVEIHRAGAVSRKLPGAPASFQRFVRRQLVHLHRVNHCDPAAIGIGVNRVRTDGFARGSVNECGGYVALWKQVDGRWRQIVGTQDIWTCRELRRNGVPSSVVGPHAQCARGRSVVAYHHR